MDNKPIPMLDLKAQYLSLKAELDAAVMRVIESTQFINGPDVEAMEQEVGITRDGAKHVIEVVGHAARQSPDGFHFLGLEELLFEKLTLFQHRAPLSLHLLSFRDVTDGGGDQEAGFGLDRAETDLDRELSAIPA